MQTPYTILGSNGTCPDSFLVTIHCGQYADIGGFSMIRHREEGESDENFWNRVMADIPALLNTLTGMPKKHVVTLTCLYNSSTFNPCPAYPSEVFNA